VSLPSPVRHRRGVVTFQVVPSFWTEAARANAACQGSPPSKAVVARSASAGRPASPNS
jgi:hypothetical protein